MHFKNNLAMFAKPKLNFSLNIELNLNSEKIGLLYLSLLVEDYFNI